MGAPRVVISGIGVVSTFGVGRESLAKVAVSYAKRTRTRRTD